MALREYQIEITKNTLYSVRKRGGVSGLGEQIMPTIEVIGGTADIYVSQVEPVGVLPAGMSVIDNGGAFLGVAGFNYIPNYLYVDEASGTITSIVLSGVEVEVVV